MNIPDRAALVEHLLSSGIAGTVATSRENNLLHYRLMADRDPYYLLGLDPSAGWTAASVLELMAERVGVSPDPRRRFGTDTIDPERTLDALDRYADRAGSGGAARRDRAVRHRPSAQSRPALPGVRRRAARPRLHDPARGRGLELRRVHQVRPEAADHRVLRLLQPRGPSPTGGDVAVLEDAGGPVHSHAPRPIRATFAALAAAGRALPDLVVADHGWCGGAAQAGADAVGFADCNDPALFVGEREGVVRVAVPLDDGLEPEDYAPIGAYVLARLDAAAEAVAGS